MKFVRSIFSSEEVENYEKCISNRLCSCKRGLLVRHWFIWEGDKPGKALHLFVIILIELEIKVLVI